MGSDDEEMQRGATEKQLSLVTAPPVPVGNTSPVVVVEKEVQSTFRKAARGVFEVVGGLALAAVAIGILASGVAVEFIVPAGTGLLAVGAVTDGFDKLMGAFQKNSAEVLQCVPVTVPVIPTSKVVPIRKPDGYTPDSAA